MALVELKGKHGPIRPNTVIPKYEMDRWDETVKRAHINLNYIKQIEDPPGYATEKEPAVKAPPQPTKTHLERLNDLIKAYPARVEQILAAAEAVIELTSTASASLEKPTEIPKNETGLKTNGKDDEWKCWKCEHEPFKSSRALKVHLNKAHKEGA